MVLSDLSAELGFLWAFGGSDRWPLHVIDREMTASTELLRAMRVIPAVG